MNRLPNFRSWIAVLLTGGVLLPIAICLVLGVGTLLAAMGDSSGGTVLNRVSLALAIIWVFDLIVLVLIQGVNHLFHDPDDNDHSEP